MNRPSVLFVHNRYQEAGGEDSVLEAESNLLEAHGLRVGRLLFDNRDLADKRSKREDVALAVGTVWSQPARQRLRDAIAEHRPDVVHFHNTLPLVSPAAYSVCHENGAAVVQTLHNYRLVCPNGLLYRDGKVCEDCLGKSLTLPALQHACYRGSKLQTATVSTMLAFHRLRGTYRKDVDVYIAPSEFLKRKLVAGGLDPERIAIKPNFVAPDPGPGEGGGGYALFVGRLTQSKGVDVLLRAYEQSSDLPPLHIAGDGDMAPDVRRAAEVDPRITYRGRLDREGVAEAMGHAACLVFPSVWYENFPVTLVEAFARGLPVLASRLGAPAEIVAEGCTGRLFKAGDAHDLAVQMKGLFDDRQWLAGASQACRDEYLSNYTGDRNFAQLMQIYERAIAASREGVPLSEQRSPVAVR
jgi:glycosyltransferase involved in cell wall biosynthesis